MNVSDKFSSKIKLMQDIDLGFLLHIAYCDYEKDLNMCGDEIVFSTYRMRGELTHTLKYTLVQRLKSLSPLDLPGVIVTCRTKLAGGTEAYLQRCIENAKNVVTKKNLSEVLGLVHKIDNSGEILTENEISKIESMVPGLKNCFIDEVTASSTQVSKLRAILVKYADLYSERKLIGQRKLKKPELYFDEVQSKLTSELRLQYGSKEVSIYGSTNSMFCHSLLLMNSLKMIKLHYLEPRIIEDIVEDGTVWSTEPFEWDAVVDLLSMKEEFKPRTNNSKILTKGVVELDLSLSRLRIEHGKWLDIQLENTEIKLLKMLILSNEVVKYKDIAESLNLSGWSEGCKNTDVSREVGDVRKKLKKELSRAGLENEKFSKHIRTVRTVGFVFVE